jgi:hypothetical protein
MAFDIGGPSDEFFLVNFILFHIPAQFVLLTLLG